MSPSGSTGGRIPAEIAARAEQGLSQLSEGPSGTAGPVPVLPSPHSCLAQAWFILAGPPPQG